jgi:hypothetical protein
VPLDGDPATNIPHARRMARITPDELRRQSGANVDPNARGYAHRASTADAERPIRHLVIFPARVLGAAPVGAPGR